MTLEIQYNLKSNPNYIKYIRENSNWYKVLNRYPELFKQFTDEVKAKYNLRPTDRISKALNTIELLQNVLSTLK